MERDLIYPPRHDHRWIEEKNHAGVQEFVVHILWAEVEFDVKYGIVKRAKLRGVEGKATKNYKFTKSDEDWLLRAVDKAVHNAKAKCGWACKHVGRFSSDELLETPMEYNFNFKFDGEKWLGSSQDLMNYIHTYITDSCLAEWLEMEGNPTYAGISARAEEAIQKAWEEINHVLLDETPKFIL